jgi:hypothetical protein
MIGFGATTNGFGVSLPDLEQALVHVVSDPTCAPTPTRTCFVHSEIDSMVQCSLFAISLNQLGPKYEVYSSHKQHLYSYRRILKKTRMLSSWLEGLVWATDTLVERGNEMIWNVKKGYVQWSFLRHGQSGLIPGKNGGTRSLQWSSGGGGGCGGSGVGGELRRRGEWQRWGQ